MEPERPMTLPAMKRYEDTRANLRFETPEHYNFGFDLIDRLAEDPDKVAYIAVDATAETIIPHTFKDLSLASNRVASWLTGLGCAKGDLAFVMIPRLPAWYEIMIGCAKSGVVAMPGTNLLTPKDIEYRVQKSGAKLAIVTADNAAKVDEIRATCPSLEHFIVIGEAREGWLDYEDSRQASASFEAPGPTKSSGPDVVLLHLRHHLHAQDGAAGSWLRAGSSADRPLWMDLHEDDIHWTLSDTGWAKAAWGMLYAPCKWGRLRSSTTDRPVLTQTFT